ncbi:uncharacterized protein F5891DRAFT_985441 [Suillus fuscotomentosus]|uniref:Uncharacterized protein n=1 Tax=Suillus fuscotomentosus TaxID=1912939 RepID=A0AAD4DWH6_9AGAM|nr:uncharacterized protein F5891DRAFT_985441 [Suillus fuscotomentosus]KAG1893898.1 hypothetical protein F5891DRAFT_985441 [Suillus fuscotomentosus]
MVISSVAELMDSPLVDTLDTVYENFSWPAKKLLRGRVLEGMKFAYEEKEMDSITWGLPLPSPSSSMMNEIHDTAFSPILVEHAQMGLIEATKAQERGTWGRGCLPVSPPKDMPSPPPGEQEISGDVWVSQHQEKHEMKFSNQTHRTQCTLTLWIFVHLEAEYATGQQDPSLSKKKETMDRTTIRQRWFGALRREEAAAAANTAIKKLALF